MCAEDYRIPDRIVLGIMFGNLGGGITEPELFLNSFRYHFVCNGHVYSNTTILFT